MKKLIIASLFFIATTAQTFAGPIVSIRFQIGKPSENCKRFGLCTWEVSVGAEFASNGTAQINESANALVITLTTEATIGKEEYFKGSFVTFEDITTVPAAVVRALGSQTNITFEPGQYKLTKTRGGYQIVIPLN